MRARPPYSTAARSVTPTRPGDRWHPRWLKIRWLCRLTAQMPVVVSNRNTSLRSPQPSATRSSGQQWLAQAKGLRDAGCEFSAAPDATDLF